jgi:thioredoxin 1
MADVLDVTESNWETEVLQSELPVLVDFWAPWCGPCRALAPTVHALAEDFAGRVKVVKVNTEEAGALATRYSVMAIPVLMVFKGGKVVDQIVGGGHPKQRLAQKLETHLA